MFRINYFLKLLFDCWFQEIMKTYISCVAWFVKKLKLFLRSADSKHIAPPVHLAYLWLHFLQHGSDICTQFSSPVTTTPTEKPVQQAIRVTILLHSFYKTLMYFMSNYCRVCCHMGKTSLLQVQKQFSDGTDSLMAHWQPCVWTWSSFSYLADTTF